jgi:soluble lytic murein transglycosylase-like protein
MFVQILLASAFAIGANGQTPQAAPIATPAPSSIAGSERSGITSQVISTTQETKRQPLSKPEAPAAQASKDSSNTVADFKTSLRELSPYYEREAERIANENTKLKDLYGAGLISRVELEASGKSLVEAQAKVEQVRKQIADAENPLKLALPGIADMAQRSELAWTTGNEKIDSLIHDSGTRYGVDPYLVFCVISQESAFKARAISSKGAHGLMQLMPATAARFGVTDPYDPAQSISAGTRYLKTLLQLFDGRVDLALAGYNAGEGAVMKYGYQVPPYSETRNYVRLISARYAKSGAPLTVKI